MDWWRYDVWRDIGEDELLDKSGRWGRSGSRCHGRQGLFMDSYTPSPHRPKIYKENRDSSGLG